MLGFLKMNRRVNQGLKFDRIPLNMESLQINLITLSFRLPLSPILRNLSPPPLSLESSSAGYTSATLFDNSMKIHNICSSIREGGVFNFLFRVVEGGREGPRSNFDQSRNPT